MCEFFEASVKESEAVLVKDEKFIEEAFEKAKNELKNVPYFLVCTFDDGGLIDMHASNISIAQGIKMGALVNDNLLLILLESFCSTLRDRKDFKEFLEKENIKETIIDFLKETLKELGE